METTTALTLMALNLLLLSMVIPCDGGFNTFLQSVEPCKDPEPPYVKEGYLVSRIEAYTRYNKTLLRGNLTVFKEAVAFIRFKSGREKDGKVTKFTIDYKRLTCKNILAKLIYAAAGIQYHPKNCTVMKGVYAFEGLDVNAMHRASSFVPTTETGVCLWILAFYGQAGTFFCTEMRVQVKRV